MWLLSGVPAEMNGQSPFPHECFATLSALVPVSRCCELVGVECLQVGLQILRKKKHSITDSAAIWFEVQVLCLDVVLQTLYGGICSSTGFTRVLLDSVCLPMSVQVAFFLEGSTAKLTRKGPFSCV